MKAVIFDCDGVLVDSEIQSVRIGLAAARKLGLTYTEDEYIHRFVGTTMDAFFTTLDADLFDTFGTRLSENFVRTFLADETKKIDSELAAIEGVAEAIKNIKSPLAVASSSGSKRLRFKLKKIDLLTISDPHIYSGEDMENGKPAPDLYLHAAAQLDIPAIDCFAVEDSVHGVVSAKAAGMTVIGFTGGGHCLSGHNIHLETAGADAVITHMCELSQTLAAFD
jgi:HAD superfamily hydrolase (TIGR01509 family)